MNRLSLTLAVILLQCTYPEADSYILDYIPEIPKTPRNWVHEITNLGTKIITSTVKYGIPKAVLNASKKLWKTLVKQFEFNMPLEELGKTWAYQVSEKGDMRVISMTMDSVDDYVNERSSSEGNDDSSEQEPVKFWLYTRKNEDDYEELNTKKLKSKYYLKRKPLMVITHGWISDGETNSTQLIKNALLKKLDVNAIIVDWRDIASKDYYVAASSVPIVGEKICELIKDMSLSKKFKLAPKDVRLVGHSLGAHVMGAAGNCLRKTNFLVGRITGLDPARPFFELPPILDGIKKQDALFVDIIHTNAGVLGVFFSRGHADFYPNGGIGQPGCYSQICELIKDMSLSKKFKLAPKDVRLVGHSLGAHVMGAAGNCLRKTNFLVGRITGLDPARPFFELPPILDGIKKQDALFVDIIHTNAGVLGVFFSRGHADFYPNGGIGQPGCYSQVALTPIVCDHARAYRFYAESILKDEYESSQCISYLFYKLGVCPNTNRDYMGYHSDDDAEGNYYLQTDDPEENYMF